MDEERAGWRPIVAGTDDGTTATTPWPPGDGEMARRVRAHDWAATPLGPVEAWPGSLKTAVGLMLASGHAMQLAWGPERVVLYNDAYAPMLGGRHPGALGLRFPEAWPDIWAEIEPLVARVFAGETVRFEDLPLVMTRHGRPEETWWTFSYSPVRDESGAVAGLLNVTVDATPRARAARAERERDEAVARLREDAGRHAVLLELSDALRPLADAAEVQAATARLIGARLGADRAMYAEVEGAPGAEAGTVRGQYVRPARGGAPAPPAPFPERFAFRPFGERTMPGRHRGDALVVADVDADPRFGPAERAAWAEAGVRAAVVAPLAKGGRLVAEFGVHSATPRAWTGSEVSLVREAAERTWAAAERARAEAATREGEERATLLVRFSDEVRGLSDPALVARAACRILAGRLGTDRALWAVVDRDAGEYVAEWAFLADGTRDAPARWPLDPRDPFAAEHLAGRTVAYDDCRSDPRIPAPVAAAMAERGLGAGIAVPVLVAGTLRAVLNTSQPAAPRRWRPEEVAFAEALAGRAWAEVERARAEAALREAEARQRFLLALGDAVRARRGAGERIEVAARLLGERLGASRVLYAEFDWARGVADIFNGWLAEGAGAFPTSMRLADYEGPVLDDLRAGRTVRVEGVGRRAGESAFAAIAAVGVGALLSVPLVLDGALRVNLSVHGREPRRWTDDEVALVREVAERLWAEVVRARAEAALRDGEARLRALLDGIPQIVWRAATGGRWTWSSPQWTAYTGLAEAESLDRGWLAAVHPADRDAVLAALRDAEAAGAIRVEHRLRHAGEGGRHRWVQTQALPVRAAPDPAHPEGRVLEWLGTITDVEEMRRAQEARVLAEELQHRGRNLLAVVAAVAERTLLAAGDPTEALAARLDERLRALGRAQALLSREVAAGATMGELLRLELAAHGVDGAGDGRVRLDGPEHLALPARAVQLLALALHELLTNALKHGALAAPEGRLAIAWAERRDEGGGRRLHLDWTESGVAAIPPGGPPRRGFGLALLETDLPYELDAETRLAFAPGGLRCAVALPLPEPSEEDAAGLEAT